MNIIVLISGRGSNLASLIKAQGYFKIIAVISNKPDAPGLQLAKSANIPCYSFSRSDYQSLQEFKTAVRDKAKELNPEMVVLAGYMQIIEPEFVNAFNNKIINIHPALLPKYPGLDTHNRALADKATAHGCTVHLVDTGVDTGTIIAQASVSVDKKDTEELLAERVLKREHEIYPWVLNQIAQRNIIIETGNLSNAKNCVRIQYSESAKNEAKIKDFIINNKQ